MTRISQMLVLIAAWGHAAYSATIAWDPSAGAAGYLVYQGPASGVYTNVINAGTNTQLRLALPAGDNFIAVTAYNFRGKESGYSEELLIPVVNPPAPLNLSVEASGQLTGPWISFFNTTVTNNGGQQFFRMTLK